MGGGIYSYSKYATIRARRPNKLTQWKIDSLTLTTKALEEDPDNNEKRVTIISRREELVQHFENLEKEARQKSHISWLQLGDRNTTFFWEATKKNSLLKTHKQRRTIHKTRHDKRKMYGLIAPLFTQHQMNLISVPWFAKIRPESPIVVRQATVVFVKLAILFTFHTITFKFKVQGTNDTLPDFFEQVSLANRQ